MKKYFSLLAIPVLLLATSCAQQIQMTSDEINALYAKGLTAEINTFETISSVVKTMNATDSGTTMTGKMVIETHNQLDLRDGVNTRKSTFSSKVTGPVNTSLPDVLKIEMYFNGVDTLYSKTTVDNEVEKSCEPATPVGVNDVRAMTDLSNFAPVDFYKLDLTVITPKITKAGGIYTFNYDLSEQVRELHGDEVILNKCIAKASMSFNEDGLATKSIVTFNLAATNPANKKETSAVDFTWKTTLNYNKDLKITAPANLNTYCN